MLRLSSKIRLAVSVSILTVGLGTLGDPASSATCAWGGGVSIWNNALNWGCGQVPTTGDIVTISAAGSTVNLSGATGLASTLLLGNGNILNVANTDLLVTGGALTNNGVINFGANTRFRADNTALSIDGTGTITLDNTSGYARIGEFGGTFTFGSGQTVNGSGELGFNSTSFTNNGLISADVNGRMLTVDTAGGSGSAVSFTNAGTMQATGGGTLTFAGGAYDNSGHVIQAVNGGTVRFGGDSRIIGGTIQNDATGTLIATGETQYMQNVTLGSGSTLTLTNDDLILNTGFTNNGTGRKWRRIRPS